MEGRTPLVDELLAIVWPGGVPLRLDRLIHRPLCAVHLRNFKLGLVFPLGAGEARPLRAAVSAQGERDRWRRLVHEQWAHASLAPFLAGAPPDTRWMIDSDGSAEAVVYLDDLQAGSHCPVWAPACCELMCATLALPSARQGLLTRHRAPPRDRVPGPLAAPLDELLTAGAQGLWALRWQGDEVTAVLWISESRWRRNPTAARRVAAGLGEHPAYREALALLASHGYEGYPDAVEITVEGIKEVTLGIF